MSSARDAGGESGGQLPAIEWKRLIPSDISIEVFAADDVYLYRYSGEWYAVMLLEAPIARYPYIPYIFTCRWLYRPVVSESHTSRFIIDRRRTRVYTSVRKRASG